MSRQRKSPNSDSKIRQYIDCDYFEKLSDADADYLYKFLQEYYDGKSNGIHPDQEKTKHESNQKRYKARVDLLNGPIDHFADVENVQSSIPTNKTKGGQS